jgi:hypothetical protein
MAYLMVLFQIIGDLFRDRSVSGGMKAAQAAQSDAENYIRSVSAGAGSPADEIARAKALLDVGSITKPEFESLKAKALA